MNLSPRSICTTAYIPVSHQDPSADRPDLDLAVGRVKPLCGRAWLARGVRASGMSGLPLSGLGVPGAHADSMRPRDHDHGSAGVGLHPTPTQHPSLLGHPSRAQLQHLPARRPHAGSGLGQQNASTRPCCSPIRGDDGGSKQTRTADPLLVSYRRHVRCRRPVSGKPYP
jgi:hypothetical protein